jgi:hypothetical protein
MITATPSKDYQEKVLEAAELVRLGWCRGHYAEDVHGNPVGCTSNDAVSFCFFGALRRVFNWNLPNDLYAATGHVLGVHPTGWNDSPERKRSEVVEALCELAELYAPHPPDEDDLRAANPPEALSST